MDSSNRFDYSSLRLDSNNHIFSQEGFLTANSTVTRSGIFLYSDPRYANGVRRELRHPDEVFKADSLATIAGKPVVKLHPKVGLVTPQNSSNYIVGSTHTHIDGDASKDTKEMYGNGLVSVAITIHDDDAIKSTVKGDTAETSLGYTCETVYDSGVFNGQPYDSYQKNIVYNHLALVPKGRAGLAKVHLDSIDDEVFYSLLRVDEMGDSLQEFSDEELLALLEKRSDEFRKTIIDLSPAKIDSKSQPAIPKHMATITIDGTGYEVDQSLAAVISPVIKKAEKLDDTLEKLAQTESKLDGAKSDNARLEEDLKASTERADQLDKELTGVTAKYDAQTDDLSVARDEISSLKADAKSKEEAAPKMDADEITAKACAIAEQASSIKADADLVGNDSLTLASIISDPMAAKKAVLASITSTNLDGKDDVYIDGFYGAKMDGIRESLKASGDSGIVKQDAGDVTGVLETVASAATSPANTSNVGGNITSLGARTSYAGSTALQSLHDKEKDLWRKPLPGLSNNGVTTR